MVLHNPNNWHWVNKNVRDWARDYLEKHLIGIEAKEGDVSARITQVKSMTGDADVNQRKGKVITLFDVQLELQWQGSSKDVTSAEGGIKIPEVAHDTEESEYVFEIDVQSEDSAKQPIKSLVRNKLVPQLRVELAKLGPALITEHGKDIQHASGKAPTMIANKVTSSSSINKSGNDASAASSTTTTELASGESVSINTVKITCSDEFRTPASELFSTFTSVDRLTAFTRSAPTIFEGPKPGGRFSLFGGNVSGSFVTLDEPKGLVQKWRLNTWPQGHFSQLAIHFDQNDTDGVTVMRVTWTGVPVGEEEVVRRNWEQFYVRSIKTTFGFGTIL